jgi:hypothetical protein
MLTPKDNIMELFDSINLYLMNHPLSLDLLAFFFRIKFWLLLLLAVYFMLLPYRQQQREIKEQKKLSKKPGRFLA